MTIQWTLVASFLYFEIVVIILLLLPLVSPRIWQALFRSRLCQAFAGKSTLFFSISIAILVMFFVESIREMNKYSTSISEQQHKVADIELQLHLKLFRSQRNYYISGFALFLWFVIRRLITLLLAQADLQSKIEKTMCDAQSATDKAEKLLREQNERNIKEAADNLRNIEKEKLEKQLNELRDQLFATEEELRRAKSELTTVKEQALSVTEEYEKLHEEHTALQKMMLKDVGNGVQSST